MWFFVVIFMDWEEYPLYMFTKPTFETFEECMESGKDPVMVQKYVTRMLLEFGRPMPIKGFVCVDEDKANKLRGKTSI